MESATILFLQHPAQRLVASEPEMRSQVETAFPIGLAQFATARSRQRCPVRRRDCGRVMGQGTSGPRWAGGVGVSATLGALSEWHLSSSDPSPSVPHASVAAYFAAEIVTPPLAFQVLAIFRPAQATSNYSRD
jgi:hypothetical protein